MILRYRRRLLQALALTPLQVLLPRSLRAAEAGSFSIAFGSCASQELAAKYERLAAKPNFAALRASTPIQAIWDDHVYVFAM